jgi:hypothetical protein
MARKHISQATARAWQKRLCELERQRIELRSRSGSVMETGWGKDAVSLATMTVSLAEWWIIYAAQRCGRAVVLRALDDGGTKVKIYALDV